MKILMICFVYNELQYLHHAINFWYAQGVDVYVIDNYSNDGTWEWLQENNVPSHRFSTNESFHLTALQEETKRTLDKLKPDWFVLGAADLYYGFEKGFKETLTQASKEGYNQIKSMCWAVKNTGEEAKRPLIDNYHHGERWREITLISEYNDSVIFGGDHIVVKDANPKSVPGLIVNYGACKPAGEQQIKLERRRKAWDEGLSKGMGVHFEVGAKINWVYDRQELQDIRLSKEAKYLENIKKHCK